MTPTHPFSSAAAFLLLLATCVSAFAVRPDECEQQRAFYPKDWKDVSRDARLFVCNSHYSGWMGVTLSKPDDRGRGLMSLVPILPNDDFTVADEPDRLTYRIWLDAEQSRRLKEGKYFGTTMRKEESCWVRGGVDENLVFFMDAANPKRDASDLPNFYNKAPRFTSFGGNAYECRRVK